MKKCSDDCEPCCDFCTYCIQCDEECEDYTITEPMRCDRHPDLFGTNGEYCDDFTCFRTTETKLIIYGRVVN